MKLLSAHIENFGKISNQNFDFSDGLNVFCKENGWGKSTLTAFIKVMFYGFENERVRDEFENERKKYKPWQGGVYGGSIRFKANDKVYRLNRTFGTKESEDEFLLVDATTGMASTDFTNQIGEELFAIDAAAFKRTIFLSQNDCATSATDSINAKMGNLNDVADDLNCYEGVMKKFKDELNALSPTRATGSISKLQNEISGVEKKLQAKVVIEKKLEEQMNQEEEYRIQRDELKKESRQMNQVLMYISENSVRLMKAKTLSQFVEKEEERKKECDKIKENFSGNVPEPEELKTAFSQAGELRSKEEAVRLMSLSDQEKEEEDSVEKFFEDKKFDEAEHKAKIEATDKFFELRNRYEKTLLSKDERDKLDIYSVRYAETNYRPAEMDELEKVWQEVETRRNSLMARKEAHALLESEERQAQKVSHLPAIIFILPLIGTLIAAGLLVAFYVMHNSKAFLLGSGIPAGILLILTVFMFIRWSKSRKEKPIFLQSEMLKTQIVEEEITIRNMEENLVIRLSDKGLIEEGEELSKCFWRIKTEYNEFGELKRRREQVKKDTVLDEMKEIACDVDTYLAGYLKDKYESKDLSEVIKRLFAQNTEDVKLLDSRRAVWMDGLDSIEEYAQKDKVYKEKHAKYEESVKAKEDLEKAIHDRLEKMGVTPSGDPIEQIKTLQVELQSYTTACEEYAMAKKERVEFEKTIKEEEASEEKPAAWKEGMTAEDCEHKINECSEKLEDINENMTALHNLILYEQEQLDELTAEEAYLASLKEEKTELEKRYRILQLTKDHLENSKTAFTATYIEPVSRAFEKYAKLLDSKGEYKFHLDAESNVAIEECGMPRSDRAFSTGMQDMFGICKRMAFIEAMYKDEKPMIVFDDPFTNLDEDKIAGGLQFLAEIAKEYQVIYFTCHKDRMGENVL